MNLIKLSHKNSECGFVLSCGLGAEPERNQYKNAYLSPWCHNYGVASWLIRARLTHAGKLEQEDPAKNSVLIYYEIPEAILEYNPG